MDVHNDYYVNAYIILFLSKGKAHWESEGLMIEKVKVTHCWISIEGIKISEDY